MKRCGDQKRLAPGVPHFTNRPSLRHRGAGIALGGGHFMNLPRASLHGAAIAGLAAIDKVAAASRIFSISGSVQGLEAQSVRAIRPRASEKG